MTRERQGSPATAAQAPIWQRFWSSLDGSPEEIFWDADPRKEAEDVALFRDHCDPTLPILDVGCGDGAQTRLLANYLVTVIGTDIAQAAVERPRCAVAT